MIRLIEPSLGYAGQVMEYKGAFLAAGDSMDGTGGLDSAATFDVWYTNWQRKLHEDTVPEGLVPATTYLAVDETDRLVGMIDIRHRLNDWLRNFGGHIGYSVAPHCRRQGHATAMLSLALDKCRELGLEGVLITCLDDNVGSAKTIEHNGGVLENMIDYEEGLLRRYWIIL